MSRKVDVIPRAPVARILMQAGAKRVSESAVAVFAEIIKEMAEKIGTKAVMIAKHSGRKTVHEGDVKLAAKE